MITAVRRISLFLFLVSALEVSAQVPTSVPFLNYPYDVESNGMGGNSTSLVSENSMSTIANPAQLGIFSLDHYLATGTYITDNGWQPTFGYSNTLRVTALNIGTNLEKSLELPFPVSIGLGYSQVRLELERLDIPLSTDGPTIWGTWRTAQSGDNFSVSVGLDLGVRLGIGYTLKWISSHVSAFDPTLDIGSAEGSATSYDYGALLDVPVTKIISRIENQDRGEDRIISPLLDVTIGYAGRNYGKGISYFGPGYVGLFPRQVSLGASVEIGITSSLNSRPWKLLSFVWTREATDPRTGYDSSLVIDPVTGDTSTVYDQAYKMTPIGIRPYENLILGKSDGTVGIRKGWQAQIAEFIFLRIGSTTEIGQPTYSTFGWGLRLDGMIRFLTAVVGNPLTTRSFLGLLGEHFDLQYDHSKFSSGGFAGSTFDALNIAVK